MQMSLTAFFCISRTCRLFKLKAEGQTTQIENLTVKLEIIGYPEFSWEVYHFNAKKYKKLFSQARLGRFFYVGYSVNLYNKKIINTIVNKYCIFKYLKLGNQWLYLHRN